MDQERDEAAWETARQKGQELLRQMEEETWLEGQAFMKQRMEEKLRKLDEKLRALSPPRG